ncbi:putative zinc-binding protein [Desulfoferrobacter suflitae]|uniref:putative zinc-binding protein n=1 Tax=Desulfoferrobacter suflitae TaxID=2865782 RepID=UPI002164ECD5|nr:putative zinc-binding protein [Desulfoferrobacter suflitae]MCK8603169.1 hypothetical protein [Desulfoferrobacter suflitae]
MILACSGGSNVGQLSNQAGVELTQEGFGKIFCLAGIGGKLQGFIQSAKDVPQMVVIDGCELGCAKATLEQAGVEPHGIDPRAVKAMAEVGIDISQHRSKDVSEVEQIGLDYVVTVCDRAHESCPFFPAKTKVMHVGFDDPPKLAAGSSSEEENLAHYRRVRDEIRVFVEKLPEAVMSDE